MKWKLQKIRLTAEQALAHPYLADYADPSDEPTSGMIDWLILSGMFTFISFFYRTDPFDDSFEEQNLSVMEWKSIYFLYS